ncbi:hypothetical protein [Lacrimispora sp.]|uniref:hypothetical protein n=1 Tax=Lacrimispora sp. TaxID=2719234 RepID=UPI0028ABA0E1|nr:hypothetical protein [Lacrimispora sp.]
MKKSVKKLLVIGMSVMMFTIPVYANTNIGMANNKSIATVAGDYGVGFEIPGTSVATRGLGKPTDVWNISNEPYDFGGSADNSTLYTNYKFKGKTSYTITVNNDHNKTLTVKCVGAKGGNKKIKGGNSATFTVTTNKVDNTFYISFLAPSNFDGTVK